MNQLISIFIAGLLVNNLLFSKFLDVEQLFKLLKDDKKIIFGYNLSFVLVVVLSSLFSYLIYSMILVPFNLIYLNLLNFIISSIISVYLISLLSERYCSFHEKNEEYFKLILVNNVLIQTIIDNYGSSYTLSQVIVNSLATSLGFVLMVYIFLGIQDRLSFSEVPKCFKGLPIILVVCGLIALALSGLAGLI